MPKIGLGTGLVYRMRARKGRILASVKTERLPLAQDEAATARLVHQRLDQEIIKEKVESNLLAVITALDRQGQAVRRLGRYRTAAGQPAITKERKVKQLVTQQTDTPPSEPDSKLQAQRHTARGLVSRGSGRSLLSARSNTSAAKMRGSRHQPKQL